MKKTSSAVVRVKTASQNYDIVIAPGLKQEFAGRIKSMAPSLTVVLVTDARVGRLYGKDVLNSLVDAGLDVTRIVVPAGEASKSLDQARKIYEKLLRHRIGRDAAVLALGGGVVGDLAGFIASTWMRGIPVIQLPTTLLAQVDAAIGGKTAVDYKGVKNIIGHFHQPMAVLSDVRFLAGLSNRQFRCGMAEVIKYAFSMDVRFVRWLRKNHDAIMRREDAQMLHIVRRCSALKAEIVSRDEKEGGVRAILNFGHTAGHAFETQAAGRLLHGEAVSIGMVAACMLSERMGLADSGVTGQVEELLRMFKLPVRHNLNTAEIMKTLLHDKKSKKGKPIFILTKRAGTTILFNNIRLKEVQKVVQDLSRKRRG